MVQPVAEPGLRERKKRQTRATIRDVALKLFLSRGYNETTTSQIARAANVSAGTLFNYFPTKHSLLTDDFDPIFIRHLRARPADEPPLTAFRRAMLAGLAEGREYIELSRTRARLIARTPELRAAAAAELRRDAETLAALFAARCPDLSEFDIRVLSKIVVAAVQAAYEDWIEADGKPDILALVDRALALTEAGGRLGPKSRSRPRA
jgi:AcrR family transcriptional regulator